MKFRSFKNYNTDGYEKALVENNFPEYKNFGNVNMLIQTSFKN